MASIRGYEVHGYGMRTYCKITEYGIDTPNYKCTVSFGRGIKKFCMTAAYDITKPYEIYIDRIHKKDICTLDQDLSHYEDGTVKLVTLCFYTLTLLYPHVKKYTFQDSSQIYCNGEDSKETMSMSFDYILKYNQTWYQKKFGAALPGYHEESGKIDDNSYMDLYMKSLSVLDAPRKEYLLICDSFPAIDDYKEEYELATTPREFITTLRKKLGKKYCETVGKWLNGYMLLLRVNIFSNEWYIAKDKIKTPSRFKVLKLNEANVTQLGGAKKPKNIRKTIKRKYDMIHKPIDYGFGVDTYREQS
jgi:hypothetical protein